MSTEINLIQQADAVVWAESKTPVYRYGEISGAATVSENLSCCTRTMRQRGRANTFRQRKLPVCRTTVREEKNGVRAVMQLNSISESGESRRREAERGTNLMPLLCKAISKRKHCPYTEVEKQWERNWREYRSYQGRART